MWFLKKIYTTGKCVSVLFFIFMKPLGKGVHLSPMKSHSHWVKPFLVTFCGHVKKGWVYSEVSPIHHTSSFSCYHCLPFLYTCLNFLHSRELEFNILGDIAPFLVGMTSRLKNSWTWWKGEGMNCGNSIDIYALPSKLAKLDSQWKFSVWFKELKSGVLWKPGWDPGGIHRGVG